VRVGVDATPLLGTRTGIGRYVEHLLAALRAEDGVDLVATAFTLRGGGALAGAVAPPAAVRRRPLPARGLQALWARTELPPVEWLCGPVDVFHATNFVLPPLRRAAGVVTVHDLSYLRVPETVTAASLRYRALVPRSLDRAAVVCTPSAAVAGELRAEYGLPAERVVVTPLGVDDVWFDSPAPDPGWRAARGLPGRYLLFVGSLEPRKGLPGLLRALRRWREQEPDVPPLVLAGPPGWGPALDTAGLPADAVRAVGYLDGPELRRAVAGAACLTFPSRYEGFGLPPLEALAAGVPVVATDLPVTREVLGDQAALVPDGDTDGWVAALRAAAAGGGPGTPASRRAHARRFPWSRCAAQTLEAYRRAGHRTTGIGAGPASY
jgi:glycosyltransferase involved in cell wall biosynthesis